MTLHIVEKIAVSPWQIEQYMKYLKEAEFALDRIAPSIKCENDCELAKIHGRVAFMISSMKRLLELPRL
jgi:hypothetical protein